MRWCLFCSSFAFPLVLSLIILHFALLFDLAYFDESSRLRFDKESVVKQAEKKCELFTTDREKDIGSEDVARIADKIFIYGSGDIERLMTKGAHNSQNGGLFVAYLNDNNDLKNALRIEKVDLASAGYPPNRLNYFHAHGMYFSKANGKLYVINHSGMKTLQTVVDVFKVMIIEEKVDVKYFGTINGGWGFGTLNNIVENGDNEIFVTHWFPFPLPIIPLGKNSLQISFRQKLSLARYGLAQLTTKHMFGNTGFQLCRFNLTVDYTQRKNGDCLFVNKEFPFLSANGIAIDKTSSSEENYLYVNDLFARDISKYAVPKVFPAQIDLRLKNNILNRITFLNSIPLPDLVDNIDYDDDKRILTAGGIPLGYKFVEHAAHTAMNSTNVHGVPGSMIVIHDNGKVERTLYHDGSKLDEISACTYDGTGGYAFCGTPFAAGVLVCKM